MHSIIILSHQIPTLLRECLESIEGANFPGNYEVIVVNDGGPVDIVKIAEEFRQRMSITCIRNSENMGISHSRNSGIEAASGNYVTILADNYTIEEDHFLRKSRYLENYDVVSSNVITVGRGIGAKALNQHYQFVVNNWISTAKEVDGGYTGSGFPAGAASTFRMDAVRATGLFDTTMVTGEDSDYNNRLDLKGMKRLHVPDLIVKRREDISFWKVLKKQYNYGVSLFKFRDRSNYDHVIKYELLHAKKIILLYLRTTRNIRYFPFVALLHLSYRMAIIVEILKKRWRR